jgi:putative tricarboxylic transport membrane protein
MRKYDQIGSLVWIILGICLCARSVELNLGDLHRPGPGFMPFLSGVFLILSGLALLFSTMSKEAGEEGEQKEQRIWAKANLKNIFIPLLILVGYILILEPLGFIITAFLFLFILFELTEPKRWLKHLAFSAATVFLSYLIFSVWLNCRFPQGILGF